MANCEERLYKPSHRASSSSTGVPRGETASLFIRIRPRSLRNRSFSAALARLGSRASLPTRPDLGWVARGMKEAEPAAEFITFFNYLLLIYLERQQPPATIRGCSGNDGGDGKR